MENPTPAPPRFPCTSIPVINLPFRQDTDPDSLYYFKYFWDLITVETNRYADQTKPSGILRKFSHWKHWKSTDNAEIFSLHIYSSRNYM